eukprot:4929356-Amphidinium_carterae.1
MSYYVPSFLYSLDVEITRSLDRLGFPIREWIQRNPKSMYVPLNQEFHTAMERLNRICFDDSRGVEDQLVAKTAFMATAEMELEPHAMAVQELQTLPSDVDKHFSELAKAHPISMKAVRNT